MKNRLHDQVLAAAKKARELAYAPYSKFKVGAAVATHDGRIFAGCNVENASYGLTICAERATLFAAIAAGCAPGEFAALAVVADSATAVTPCGACRQVILELGGKQLDVLMANLSGDLIASKPEAMLPGAFRLD